MLIVVAVVVVVMIFVVVVAVAIVAFVAAKWQTIEDRWPPAGRCGGGEGGSGGEVRLLPKSRPPPLPRRVKTPSQPAPATSQPKLCTNDEHFYLT